jgi:hypothetical protein
MRRLGLRDLLPLLLVPAVVWAQGRIDGERTRLEPKDPALYFWKGERIKAMTPGFNAVMADVYWLRTVQYFGGERLFAGRKTFSLLAPLVDITTTLDPRMEIAYRYGATFLAETPPTGAGQPRAAIRILEKGAAANPNSWRLRQDLGFFHYLFLQDAPTAARILEDAAALPGAAFWLRTLAADLMSKSGDRAAARRIWQQMYEQSEEGVLRNNALSRLAIIDARDQADALTSAVEAFARRAGRRPSSLAELRGLGSRLQVVDGSGVPFDYDVSTGKVTVSSRSTLWRPE